MNSDNKSQTTKEWVNIVDPFAKKLIENYLQRREDDLSLLRASLEKGKFEDIRVKGHNLSGSGSAYGLDRISEIGKGLEIAAEGRDSIALVTHIDTLEKYLKKLRIS